MTPTLIRDREAASRWWLKMTKCLAQPKIETKKSSQKTIGSFRICPLHLKTDG